MSKLQNTNSDNNNEVKSTEDRPPSTPRWVKVSGIIVISIVLLFVIMKLTGIGGNHGPDRHIPSGQQAPSSNHIPPGDSH